jgi:hypothetical protein
MSSCFGSAPRRGAVYLLALLVVVVVSGIAMVMARGTSVRLHLAQEAVARSQCRAAALGMIRAVANDLTTSTASGGVPHLVTVTPAGETIGDCTVLLIGRDPAGSRTRYDLIPEAGRIGVDSLADANVPQAIRTTAANALASLPGMTLGLVAALRDWTDADDTPDADGGAERTAGTYLSAPVPYAPRNGPLRSLDELRLVRDVSDSLFFGADANQNGRLDAGEASTGGTGVDRGLRDYLTWESREPATTVDGSIPLIQGRSLNRDLGPRLVTLFGTSRGNALWQEIQAGATPTLYANRLELFCTLADSLSESESSVLWSALIGPERRVGLVDPWSCPDPLLAALVGTELATAIAQARPPTAPTGPSWLLRVLTREEARQYGMFLTCGSYQFRADVLAVRNDGAGWVRLEARFDCASGTTLVTSLREAESTGWPLPWCPPETLRRRTADQDPRTLLTQETN